MNTTAKKPQRLTADQIANTMRTGEEWLGIHRLAITTASIWWALLGLLLVAGYASLVQAGQAVSVYTSLMRPMPPKLAETLQKVDVSAWTPETTRPMLPPGWNVLEFAGKAYKCAQVPRCSKGLKRAFVWWWTNQPKNYAAQVTTWAAGGLAALTLPALLLQADMRRWRDTETRQIQRNERQARRNARGRK